jgi:hypothetical protein
MMATTIMISTNVKPALREVLVVFIVLIVFLFLMRRERNNRRVTMITIFVH